MQKGVVDIASHLPKPQFAGARCLLVRLVRSPFDGYARRAPASDGTKGCRADRPDESDYRSVHVTSPSRKISLLRLVTSRNVTVNFVN
jgi:hypothetical protein